MQTTRRDFCKLLAATTVALSSVIHRAFANLNPVTKENPMFTLPALPYAPNALEPHMSANTFSFHYSKHHQTYVTNLNNLVKETPHLTTIAK